MIFQINTQDARFPLGPGQGSDAIHREPVYSFAVTRLHDDSGLVGTGLSFTLGAGNDLVCRAAELLAGGLAGREIEELMADFGAWQNAASNEPQLRWLGPHKGVVHLALASVTNACWDLWAKKRGQPLWRLLLELGTPELLAALDFSYLDDELTAADGAALIDEGRPSRTAREAIVMSGYPAYDTSVGWFNYDDEQVRANCRRALDAGFRALKLKVGSHDPERDLRRARIVREAAGPEIDVMLDANQQWTPPRALEICRQLREVDPYWIEEPTHPDDVAAHRALAETIAPVRVALGEHVPNRVVFKNYLKARAVGIVQVDALRVAGVSEFLVVSLLARKFGVPVVPHVGDGGQVHQHLVLFNHIALGLPALFLEHIPHLREHFVHPCQVESGRYRTPEEPGAGTDLK